MKIIILIIIFISFGIGWGVYRNAFPVVIGLHDGHLSPCPNSPNCVSSEAKDESHRIEPFPAPKGAESFVKLATIIATLPHAKIIKKTDDYLHAEFTSKMMHFVDDVEFHFLPNESIIHVRSASRVGYGDMGVNRKRVEHIRSLLEK